MNRIAAIIATGAGLGLAPFASGTFGSLLGLPLAFAAFTLGGTPGLLLATLGVTLLGFWSSHRYIVQRADGAPTEHADPGEVVIDEIAGQMLAFVAVPFTPITLLLGFGLFRLFDVLKPPPARQFEKLPGASGIMTDDLAAGVMANIMLQIVLAAGLI